MKRRKFQRVEFGKRKEWVDFEESDPSSVLLSDKRLTSGKQMAEELAMTKALSNAITEVWDNPQ